MDEPNPAPATEPNADPGERRLARPPSERYQPAATASEETATGASMGRGLALGVLAAIGTAAAISVLGGVFLVSAGLVVVAAGGGWLTGIALRLGGGSTIARSRRTWLGAGLGIVAVALGQLGLWLVARSEGGVLAIPDYLAQTFGVLVPLQFLAGALFAAWAARGSRTDT